MSARLRLRRADGQIYLDRWGWECRLGGVFVHRMDAPDPGLDLHDHPWWFASLIVRGGYREVRSEVRRTNFNSELRRRRFKSLRLDECHRINELQRTPTWTLVVHGPARRNWGFYVDGIWVPWRVYDQNRRDMWAEISNDAVDRQQARERAGRVS